MGLQRKPTVDEVLTQAVRRTHPHSGAALRLLQARRNIGFEPQDDKLKRLAKSPADNDEQWTAQLVWEVATVGRRLAPDELASALLTAVVLGSRRRQWLAEEEKGSDG